MRSLLVFCSCEQTIGVKVPLLLAPTSTCSIEDISLYKSQNQNQFTKGNFYSFILKDISAENFMNKKYSRVFRMFQNGPIVLIAKCYQIQQSLLFCTVTTLRPSPFHRMRAEAERNYRKGCSARFIQQYTSSLYTSRQ